MCRMLAIISKSPIKADYLRMFRKLAETGKVKAGAEPGHRDGWGILYYVERFPRHLGRCPSNALEDEGFEVACKELERLKVGGIVLAHLRKSSGTPPTLENTQPLVSGRWSFAHNGTIYSPSFNRCNGQSDSIALFERLIEEIDLSSTSTEQTIVRVVRQIRHEILGEPDEGDRKYSSLTFMLTDGQWLYALRDFTRESEANYYTMHYRSMADEVVFYQQDIFDGGWKTLDNKQLAIVDPSGQVRIESC